ncbi:MAG: YebC/PmpR family DNA-binding transcriptional regulator [Deltaproteobacteria bacterium]|nr:YebC/PmpR family DNA-binding transcriptional regulator [Deltaproteobacteria bacterium]MBN2671423.1 YebC/PmpR family DNA-binding transcriptional regulator [Deltaproteobacteria bacterium]
MSGHSKWSNIKRKKGAVDAKRGKIFTKVSKEITTAARIGGGDPTGNARLRKAIDAARAANMPADTVDRAIKKGTGEIEGVIYEEITYEGYGPEGVAVIVECMTENRQRTVADVRHLFAKFNGNLGQDGCVSYMFDKVGLIEIERENSTEDQLMEVALEAGADDIKETDSTFEVVTPMENFDDVLTAITDAGIETLSAELTRLPQTTVRLEGKSAETMLKLYTRLDDHDDVQNVYANFDIDDEVLENFSL